MKHKLTALILMVAMLCSLMPLSAFASGEVTGAVTAIPVDVGVRLSWDAIDGAESYSLRRFYTSGAVVNIYSDGPITATSLVDVEVDANTEYTYGYVPVMAADSNATDGSFDVATVTTGATILGGDASELADLGIKKRAILMKVDDPDMSVNGNTREIDPGRGTSPTIVNSRTLVPIRAIIEAMGGSVGWEDATQKITLDANGHNVEMWLDKTELIVDGASKTMDVAPQAINDRTMVPVRFAAENVGCAVGWIEATSEIVIVYFEGGTPPGLTPGTDVTVTPDPGPGTTPDPDLGPGTTPDPDPGTTQPPAGAGLGDGPEIKTTYSAAELAGILAPVEALLRDAPTGGRVIPESELFTLLGQYDKDYGSGAVSYSKALSGTFEKSGGKWSAADAELVDRYFADDSRFDSLYLKDMYSPEREGTVDGRIHNEDANFYYTYRWTHGDSAGYMSKYPKETDNGYIPGGTFDIEVMRYDDAVVDGQECIVYSYNYGVGDNTYYWYSKTKGHDILSEMFMSGTNEIYANFTYVDTRIAADSSLFDTTKQGVSVWEESDY